MRSKNNSFTLYILSFIIALLILFNYISYIDDRVILPIYENTQLSNKTKSLIDFNVFSDIYNKNINSIVTVQSYLLQKSSAFKRSAGVIITDDGYILTTSHTIRYGENISVLTKDLHNYKASIVGVDLCLDLALLKINSIRKFSSIEFGTMNDVKIGSFVMSIGNMFGLIDSATMGIVGGINRHRNGTLIPFIQVDSLLNRGSSGGAVINTKGHFIGMNMAVLKENGGYNTGIGFVLPVNLIKFSLNQLKSKGVVDRIALGINGLIDNYQIIPNNKNGASVAGVIITGIINNSIAYKSGLKIDDKIVEFNNRPINTIGDLYMCLLLTKSSDRVEIGIVRNKEKKFIIINEV